MRSQAHPRIRMFDINSRVVISALTLTVLFALVAALTPAAQAQTYSVLHNFTDGQDGATPTAGVTLDTGGNIYGTAEVGGIGYGTVYKLKRSGANYILNPLFSFNYYDGDHPLGRVTFGPQGLLYGTTNGGGTSGLGVIFKLQPPVSSCRAVFCSWTETVLYNFPGPPDGWGPGYSDLLFDSTNNMYGTTIYGGNGLGNVYKQTPPLHWGTETVLYSFSGPDGENPYNGVIFDTSGNLDGTTVQGGRLGYGTVFQLSSLTGESLLHSFTNGDDGSYPWAGLISDSAGNLYGAASNGGTGGGGIVFELSPPNQWTTFTVLYSFTGTAGGQCGPRASLSFDSVGNLYGTTYCDGANGYGNVFELTPNNGNWRYTDLYDFCPEGSPCTDGANPISNVSIDGSGNLYGTASDGGSQTVGVVWKIMP